MPVTKEIKTCHGRINTDYEKNNTN